MAITIRRTNRAAAVDAACSVPLLPGRILPLIHKLAAALQAEDVVFCQWKGQQSRERWARGEGDIDLLVHRAAVQTFVAILHRLGFKEVLPPFERRIPGVHSFYGYDEESNRFVHVHAHYQLVIGHPLTLNYRLPCEDALLVSARQGELFPIPSPEFEFIVLVLRRALAYSAVAATLGQDASQSTRARDEFDALRARTQPTRLRAVLEQHLPFLDAALFESCVRSLQPGCASWRRVGIRRRLQHRLKSCARRSRPVEFLLRQVVRAGHRMRRLVRRRGQNRLASGGLIIALVGGDGAGKSTAVESLYSWLSPRFDVKKVHLGKPPRSLLTLAAIGLRRVSSLVGKLLTHGHACPSPDSQPAGRFGLLRALAIARDRYQLYQRLRRFATNGRLVLCDRYPIPQIRCMDCAVIPPSLPAQNANRFARLLARREASLYSAIAPPDLLVVLKVHPDLAVARKTEEEPLHVRGRSREIWELQLPDGMAKVIDAARPPAEVLAELRSLVWSYL
jgi:thymidylate kinase